MPENQTEELILSALQEEPCMLDEIMQKTSLPVQIISASLSLMELKGFIIQVEGAKYKISHGKSILKRNKKDEI